MAAKTGRDEAPDRQTLAPYAGRWVALVRGRVVGVGWTRSEAIRAARRSRPKDEPETRFVPVEEEADPESGDDGSPDWPWRVIRRLAQARGQRVWLVGGAVRDRLIGRPIHDWDFAVDKDALALARAAADALDGAYYAIDAERGTGRAIVAAADGARLVLDVATLRGDSLVDDLRVRDFTINAMAMDAQGGIADPTEGQADLSAGLIRATHEQAFQDDPLRLLRAVRVGAELGFEIEAETTALIRRDAALLAQPSAERVRDEFVRVIGMAGAASHVQRLDELGLLGHVLPELTRTKGVLQSPPHLRDVWQHTLAMVEVLEGIITGLAGGVPGGCTFAEVPSVAWAELAQVLAPFGPDLAAHLAVGAGEGAQRTVLLKLGALLHDIGKPDTWSEGEDGRIHFYDHDAVGAKLATGRLRNLRFSSDAAGRVALMVGGHLRALHLARAERVTRRAIYRYFRALGDAGIEVLLLGLADHLATWGGRLQAARWARRLEVAETLLTHYFLRHEETIAPATLVKGRDLMAELGLEAGPEIGRLLELVREAQAAGEVQTRDEALALARQSSGTKNA